MRGFFVLGTIDDGNGRMKNETWNVLDLFSGAGGMSSGFHAHPRFNIVGAVDAQRGKPSTGYGTLECNRTYRENIGIVPIEANLAELPPKQLRKAISGPVDILISCAPCTGFSRTNSKNHLEDDPRNSLVSRSALYVEEFRPSIFLMENARELIRGNFTHHFENLSEQLQRIGYEVHAENHFLNRFGLPQKRERALVVAVEKGLPLLSLGDLWRGRKVKPEATHVRHAISELPPLAAGETDPVDPMHTTPQLTDKSLHRLQLLPHSGGSWADLKDHPDRETVLIPSMLRNIAAGKMGSHPDVYGRLWWDRPAVTIKRECAHIGNGRYSHPEQDRMCSVRELATLQGFPSSYTFVSSAMSNLYRHIGDAVPPLISYQIAWLCDWILTGKRPTKRNLVLKDTHLSTGDIVAESQRLLPEFV